MKKIRFIPAVLMLGFAACSGGGDKGSTSDTTATVSADTTHKAADTTQMITPLPDVPAGAKVYFKNLKDGETVKSPLKVEFGVDGIALDTAGAIKAASGHHHLLIDAGDSIMAGTVVPKDSTHLHFGKAQTGTEIKLAPGEHKLTLQYADGIHRSYGAKLSATIKVKVK
ncbi:MAG TPA: DUF4399 domain-containing protein [Puia sp.]|nr:DUF4399 domain-containing protein [Puia sp.]